MDCSEMPVYYKCPNYLSEETTVSFTGNFGNLSWTVPIWAAVKISLFVVCLCSDCYRSGQILHTLLLIRNSEAVTCYLVTGESPLVPWKIKASQTLTSEAYHQNTV